MEIAFLKQSCVLKDGSIVPAYSILNGPEANKLYFKTGKKHEYICPHCNITLVCINENVRFPLRPEDKGKRNPHFTPKLKNGDHQKCPGVSSRYFSKTNKQHKYTI